MAEWRIAETQKSRNCTDKLSQHEAVISSIKQDLTQIAKLNDVTEDEVSVGHVEELRRQMELPESCTVLSSAVAAVAKILRETYPSDWGFDGEGTKDQIGKELARALERLSNTTDEEYADQVISRMVAFAEASKDYYLPVITELSKSSTG